MFIWDNDFWFLTSEVLENLSQNMKRFFSPTGHFIRQKVPVTLGLWQNPTIFKVLFVALLIFPLCSLWAGFKGARHGVGDDKSAVAVSEPKKWQQRGRSLLLTK